MEKDVAELKTTKDFASAKLVEAEKEHRRISLRQTEEIESLKSDLTEL